MKPPHPRRLPCRTLQIKAWPGTEPWVLTADQAKRLSCLLTRNLEVEYVPRNQVGQVWRRDHAGREMPVNLYAFRAYSRGNKAVLFVDDTETQASATWLLLHELAHLELPSASLLYSAYRSIPKPPNYLTNDAAHESHPEEQLANHVATETMSKLGLPGKALDRLWWRQRVRRKQARRLRRSQAR